MIAVTFALPSESSDFLRLLQDSARTGADTCAGRLHGQRISVLHTGVGEKTTRARLQTFLEQERPRVLISAGFAGALNNRWQIGDILLAENYSDPKLLPATRALSCRPGRLVTAPGMIDSLSAREELAQASGADAVEMETEFIAAACAVAGIPMLSLRAISDTPATPFPAPPNVLFDTEQQRTRFTPLFFYLLTHPLAISRLLVFARQIASVRQSLTRALELLLRSELLQP